MTAKERLRQVVDDLSEDEAVDVLEMLSGSRVFSGQKLTRIDGIPGALESAQLGRQEQESKTISLDELRVSR